MPSGSGGVYWYVSHGILVAADLSHIRVATLAGYGKLSMDCLRLQTLQKQALKPTLCRTQAWLQFTIGSSSFSVVRIAAYTGFVGPDRLPPHEPSYAIFLLIPSDPPPRPKS